VTTLTIDVYRKQDSGNNMTENRIVNIGLYFRDFLDEKKKNPSQLSVLLKT
jgi:hypothetical protein